MTMKGVLNPTNLLRLSRMGLPEIRFRLAQKLRIGRELVVLSQNAAEHRLRPWGQFWDVENVSNPVLRNMLSAGDDNSAAALLAEYLFSRKAPSFYFSCEKSDELIREYGQAFPTRITQIIEEAERLREHRLKIYAYPEVKCGEQVHWRKDLVHGTESGLDHWSRIPYLEFVKVGDSKIVWEPNRHQHLVTLALAYRLAGNERFAEECFTQWEDWQIKNPYLCGINWASSLELAFRAWSWIWMLYLLVGSRAMTGRRLAKLMRALALHADFISANLSIYFSPNTHLLGEGFALFVIGLLFPELRSSEFHRETGRRILIEECTKQVRSDGSHAEQSTYYHRYATDFFLCASILADRNNCPFPSNYRAQLERMVEFMLYTAWPDGTHPMVGDADGGRVLPFGARNPNDNRGTISTAAVYFDRGDFRDRAGQLYEETLLLLGPEGAHQFDRLGPKPPRETSKAFQDSGIAVMRSAWSHSSNMLLFDAGPQGAGSCGHGHADALSVVCSAYGTNWLVDPGTFVYTASTKWRDFFRSTWAHNTLVVDGHTQAEPRDTFKWRRVCPARLERWVALPNLDYATGSHEGYTRFAEPLVHRRRVIFVKPDRWFLLDELSGAGTHLLEFFFHFSPGIELQVEKHGCSATEGLSRFLLIADARMILAAHRGGENPMHGWYSEDYGYREPAPVLTGKVLSRVPVRIPWVLWPNAPADVKLHAIAGSQVGWAVESIQHTDYFFFADPESDNKAFTDGEFAFLRVDVCGQLERLVVLGGSAVRWQGNSLLRADGIIEQLDLAQHDGVLEIQMSPEIGFALQAPSVKCVCLNGRNVSFERNGSMLTVRRGN
jgi:hypothetical protein